MKRDRENNCNFCICKFEYVRLWNTVKRLALLHIKVDFFFSFQSEFSWTWKWFFFFCLFPLNMQFFFVSRCECETSNQSISLNVTNDMIDNCYFLTAREPQFTCRFEISSLLIDGWQYTEYRNTEIDLKSNHVDHDSSNNNDN